MKKTNAKRIFAIVLIDLLLFAVCLLSFAYLHHARRMLSDHGGDDVVVKRPLPSHSSGTDNNAAGNTFSSSDTDSEDSSDNSSVDTDSNSIGEIESGVTTAAEDDTNAAPHKFEAMFAHDGGEPEVTDTYYRSHDIYMTVTEVTEPISDYIARYYIYDIYVRYTENLFTVAHKNNRYPFTELIEEAGSPVAALSGDFWRENADIAVRNGVMLRQDLTTENDFCVMYLDGSIKIYAPSELPGFEITDDIYQIWNFGPSLLDEDGHAKTSFGAKNDIQNRNPRASIGYYEPGHYCFIAVEGRRHITYGGERVYLGGMRFTDLSKLYESLGCVSAYNLDGGDSAFAYYNGEILRQDWSRAHEEGQSPRKIYDIICIGELEE